MQNESPLAKLIQERTRLLGLTALQLGYRLNYTNPSKAVGRVQALCDGFVQSSKSRSALDKLPAALEITQERFAEVLVENEAYYVRLRLSEETEKERLISEERLRWLSSFRPHAIIDTASKVPSSIIMCGMTGGVARWLYLKLDDSLGPETYLKQALALLPHKPCIPFFGRALGFYINHSPYFASYFTWSGGWVEDFPQAHWPGEVHLWIGGRAAKPSAVAKTIKCCSDFG